MLLTTSNYEVQSIEMAHIFDELLIKTVQDNTLLYDKQNKYFRNCYRREKAWNEVAKKTQHSGKYKSYMFHY